MRTMRALSAALVLSLTLGVALPAAAGIMEVTASVTMPSPATEDDVNDAVGVAAQEVLSNIGALQPAIMVVTAAYLSAGRLYVRFLVADEVGARLLGIPEERPEVRVPGTSDSPQGLSI